MKNEYLEAGKFCGTHGVKGDIKAECWCDDVKVLTGLHTVFLKTAAGYRELKTERCVPFKDLVLMHIAGYDTPEDAAALKNKIFYAKREDIPLPEGRFFIADLLGLDVFDEDSKEKYGVLTDVLDGAASQLYEIRTPGQKTVYLPVVPQFVIRIDPETGIFIRPVKGLFDEN